MAKIAYFDCFSGASGDMVIGALLDLGLPLEALREALGSLAIECGDIGTERVLRAGVSATRFRVSADENPAGVEEQHQSAHAAMKSDRQRDAQARQHDDQTQQGAGSEAHEHPHAHHHGHDHAHDDRHGHPHPHTHDSDGNRSSQHAHGATGHGHHSLEEIARQIGRSALSSAGKARAIHLFETLGAAEAAIHDIPIERIHLHEVGAIDSIVDIVGAVFGMEWLGADEVVVSPLNVGSGTVWCAHGEFPVPAPATARLLTGAPIYAGAVATELVTPTGALLMTAYARRFGELPAMRLRQIGYGAGSRDFKQHPNVLRLLVGDTGAPERTERIVVIESEIDDMNPQLFGPLMDDLYRAGALDVFYVPVQMKKNRPGTLVTVVAPPERREALSGVLFAGSTTIGVRYQEMWRERLDREMRTIETAAGPVRFKVATRDGRVLNAAPEFEDCARAAALGGLSIKEVQAMAVRAWVDAQDLTGER